MNGEADRCDGAWIFQCVVVLGKKFIFTRCSSRHCSKILETPCCAIQLICGRSVVVLNRLRVVLGTVTAVLFLWGERWWRSEENIYEQYAVVEVVRRGRRASLRRNNFERSGMLSLSGPNFIRPVKALERQKILKALFGNQ